MNKIEKKYTDGWEGFTKKDYDKMYNVSPSQFPIYPQCYSGGNIFDAGATLRANGLHPDKIPEALRDNEGLIGEIIKKIAKKISLKYVPTPDKAPSAGTP